MTKAGARRPKKSAKKAAVRKKATRKAACSSKLTFHYTYYCGSKKFSGSAYDADGDHYNMPWIKISCGDYVHHAGLGNTVLRSSMN